MSQSQVLAGVLAIFIGLVGNIPASHAQADPGDHASHHPGAVAPDPLSPAMPAAPEAPSFPPPAGNMGMMEMMKEMMGPASPPPLPTLPTALPLAVPTPLPGPAVPAAPGSLAASPMVGPAGSAGGRPGGAMVGSAMGGGGCCGGGQGKPFYPALMDMPALTSEARRFIEAEGDRRLGTGTEQITTGQAELHRALGTADGAAVQRAAEGVRRGLFLVESGAAAEQAVSEGQAPTKVALTWFKSQSNVPGAGTVATDGMSMDAGLWGLSWFHVTLMGFLIAFLGAALAIYFARARRVAGLVERLDGKGNAEAKPADKPPPPAPAGGKAALPPAAAPAKPAGSTQQKLWSGPLRVAAIFDETPTVKTFRLMNPDGGPIPFTFQPGQFLSFSAEIDGRPIRRSYTIASAPTQRDYVELTVKREEHGAESRYLHDCVAVGDQLEVKGPSGVFTFTGSETDSIVLIAGGVGITPMMCITRFLTDRSYRGDIFLLYGVRNPQQLIFAEEFEYLRKRHSNFHFFATMSESDGTGWTGAKGLISKEFIANSVPDIARRRVHVCGPPPMLEAVQWALADLGVPKEKVKTESFAAPAPPPAPSPAKGGGAPAPAPDPVPPAKEAPGATAAPAAAPGDATVEFTKSGKSGALAPDQSVLEAAEAIGVSIDFVCRVGTCGTCVVPLTSGTVTMAVEEGLPPDQKARGIILACQAKSASSLTVDA